MKAERPRFQWSEAVIMRARCNPNAVALQERFDA